MSNTRHCPPDARHFVEEVEKPDREREFQGYEKTHTNRKRIDCNGQPSDGVQRLRLEKLS